MELVVQAFLLGRQGCGTSDFMINGVVVLRRYSYFIFLWYAKSQISFVSETI